MLRADGPNRVACADPACMTPEILELYRRPSKLQGWGDALIQVCLDFPLQYYCGRMACSGTILRCIDHCDGLQVTRSKIGKARMQECLRDVQGIPVLIVTGAKDRCAAPVTMEAVASSNCSVLLLGDLPCQTPLPG